MSTKKNYKRLPTHTKLNFVSPHSLESIVDEMHHSYYENVQTRTIPVESDTVLFQLAYQYDGRITAQVHGRLRRWADDMTHIHCEGKARPRIVRESRIGCLLWGLIAIGVVTTAALLLPIAPRLIGLGGGILLLLIPFVFYKMSSSARIGQPVSQPEHKDRDYLLDIMVDIIADDDTPPRLAQAAHDNALSEQELALLYQEKAKKGGVVL